jgi:hypothetical protein
LFASASLILPLVEMKISPFLVLFLLVLVSVGCQNKGSRPSNPFAQNSQTIPPPATFSSQESYLGQIPGSYVPQTPAATFPSVAPTQPAVQSDTSSSNVSGEKATLFAAATTPVQETGWVPADVPATDLTAFQTMDSKVVSSPNALVVSSGVSESLIVGTSHVVTTITDHSQPTTTLTEPAHLYSGKYTE